MGDFSSATPAATPGGASASAAASSAAAAALIHSASQINELSGFSSLAQVCQYGSQFSDPTSLYASSTGLEAASGSVTSPTSTSATASPLSSALAPGSIASFGFTQEQVACVCEVLEQSGNIDRLAR